MVAVVSEPVRGGNSIEYAPRVSSSEPLVPMNNRTACRWIGALGMSALAGALAWAGAIHDAATNGELKALKDLIATNRGAVTERDAEGNLALHLAAAAGRADAVSLLLENQSDVAATNKNGLTPLHLAVYRVQPSVARLLVEKQAPIDATDILGRTPLHYAVTTGDVTMTQFLLAHGANIEAKAKGGYTPLHLATLWDRKDVASLLLNNGASMTAKDANGLTPLQLAVQEGKPEVLALLAARLNIAKQKQDLLRETVRSNHLAAASALLGIGVEPDIFSLAGLGQMELMTELLRVQPNLTHTKDPEGDTPLHWAARSGQTNSASLLLAKGAEVDARNKLKLTPLHLAAANAHRAMAELLLSNRADINAADKNGRTALSLAWAALNKARTLAADGDAAASNTIVAAQATISLLCEKGASVDLFSHILAGDREAAAALIQRDPNAIHKRNHKGNQPLHCAANAGDLDFVRLLLDKGADPNAHGQDKQTPLHLAAAAGKIAVAELLLAKGAQVDTRDELGRTPLYLAVVNDETGMVAFLLARKADPNMREKTGKTPAHQASRRVSLLLTAPEISPILAYQSPPIHRLTAKDDFKELTNLLASDRALANLKDSFGRTPLHLAAANGSKKTVALLLERGANPNLQRMTRCTPLHTAAATGDIEIARMLLAAGARLTERDQRGWTPLEWAQNAKKPQMQEFLRAGGKPATQGTSRMR